VVPLTVQTLAALDEKLTARPELAVAETANASPTVRAGNGAKLML
jgi:hypothetical protein